MLSSLYGFHDDGIFDASQLLIYVVLFFNFNNDKFDDIIDKYIVINSNIKPNIRDISNR